MPAGRLRRALLWTLEAVAGLNDGARQVVARQVSALAPPGFPRPAVGSDYWDLHFWDELW